MKKISAAEKWCPFYRQPTGVGGEAGDNREAGSGCITTDCMAWRETDNEPEEPAQPGNRRGNDRTVEAGFCSLMSSTKR